VLFVFPLTTSLKVCILKRQSSDYPGGKNTVSSPVNTSYELGALVLPSLTQCSSSCGEDTIWTSYLSSKCESGS
jgi:hypothetical protein